jgi:tetratricopeptide (TPR) repeat protein
MVLVFRETRGGKSRVRYLAALRAAGVSLFLVSVLAFGASATTLEKIQGLIQKGDLAGAKSELNELLKSSPRDPNAWNMLGVVEAQQSDYHAAESSFQRAIALAPGFTGAYLNLGHLYQDNFEKDPEALKKGVLTYERLLKFDPNDPEANYQCAFLLLQLGSFQASLDHLSRLPPEARNGHQALAAGCADYGGLKRQSEADAAAERLLNSPDLQEADVTTTLPPLVARHEDALALKLLEGLAERRLASPNTLIQLATLYQSAGNLDRARATLEAAAQLQGSVSVPLLLALAHVAFKQGDHEGTLGYLAHARDLDPNNAAVHFFFGMVCVEMNLSKDAYNSLKKATALNPNNPYYNYALGAVIMSREDVQESYPYFKKYCELKPNDPRGRLALGSAYFYGNNLDLAHKELKEIVACPQTAATAHYFLGRIANREGNLSEAEREIIESLQIRPQYADAYAELALLEMKRKEYPAAEEALQKAIKISPDSYTANLNLMILYQRTKDPRADGQARRFQEITKQQSERRKEFLRTIEVSP